MLATCYKIINYIVDYFKFKIHIHSFVRSYNIIFIFYKNIFHINFIL